MSIKGWLLDVRIQDDETHLWVKTRKKRIHLKDRYDVDFFVIPSNVRREKLIELFDEHDNIAEIEKVERYPTLNSIKRSPVLRVKVDSYIHYREICNIVSRYGEIYDNDISHTQRYLADKELIPLGKVLIQLDTTNHVKRIEAVPQDLSIPPPPLKVLCFELHLDEDQLDIITLDEGMRQLQRFSGSERETLASFTEYVKQYDPDMFASMDVDMKCLLSLQIRHGHSPLGYFHRKHFNLEEGRIHLNMLTYRRMSLAGMVERVQFNREVPRICSNWAAGRAIESRQTYEARRGGYLLPRNGYVQPVMSLGELLREKDHGALIFTPSVGLHENVGALDFESMFPHLILKNNISYENLDDPRDSEGFLSGFTRDTLVRRLYFKHKRNTLKDKPMEWFWCETRQQALKEILFCTYGYSGCWANRFGNMATFMEINKAARVNLVKAMNHARERGFHTLYGNSDSLFLKRKNATREDFTVLSKEITEVTGLPIIVENHFKYLVLLPQKSGDGFGAINRYYGMRYDGELVCRGIELRRRNTCPFVLKTQREALMALLSKDSAEEVLTAGVEDANKVISNACRSLKRGLVPIDDLVSKTILRRKPFQYKAKQPHVTAAEALEINKNIVGTGDIIKYVHVDSEHMNPFRRVSPAGYQQKYDSKKYCQLVKEAGRSILMIFQQEEEKRKNTKLDSFFNP